ncbi:CAP domain-containing protein, partial [Fennellomyces sp. T-0311]
MISMIVSFVVLLLLSSVLAAPTNVLDSPPSVILETHNELRALHGSPPLTWNDDLANFAQSWSSECVLQHSGGQYGENIAKGTVSWEQSITAWYQEEAQYDFDRPGFSEGTGHFTQLIWKSTEQVGCGAVYCPNLNGNYYTCEYYPRGNILSATSDT